MYDLIIKNARLIFPESVREGDILVANGKIVGITKRGLNNDARQVLDADGRYVIPGAIDTHSHIGQMPGQGQLHFQTQEENFETESLSALYGGVTTALNYIFSQESLEKVLPIYNKLAQEHSYVNIKFHGAIMNDVHLQNIDQYINKLGIRSFKIFLPYKGEEALNLGGLSSLNDGQLVEAFSKLKMYGGLPIIHA